MALCEAATRQQQAKNIEHRFLPAVKATAGMQPALVAEMGFPKMIPQSEALLAALPTKVKHLKWAARFEVAESVVNGALTLQGGLSPAWAAGVEGITGLMSFAGAQFGKPGRVISQIATRTGRAVYQAICLSPTPRSFLPALAVTGAFQGLIAAGSLLATGDAPAFFHNKTVSITPSSPEASCFKDALEKAAKNLPDDVADDKKEASALITRSQQLIASRKVVFREIIDNQYNIFKPEETAVRLETVTHLQSLGRRLPKRPSI